MSVSTITTVPWLELRASTPPQHTLSHAPPSLPLRNGVQTSRQQRPRSEYVHRKNCRLVVHERYRAEKRCRRYGRRPVNVGRRIAAGDEREGPQHIVACEEYRLQSKLTGTTSNPTLRVIASESHRRVHCYCPPLRPLSLAAPAAGYHARVHRSAYTLLAHQVEAAGDDEGAGDRYQERWTKGHRSHCIGVHRRR